MRGRRRARSLAAKALVAVAGLVGTSVLVACGAGDEGPAGVGSANGLPEIENDLGPAAYREVVGDSLDLLHRYWTRELEAEGEDSRPPARLLSYWNRRQDAGCAGEPAGAFNAQYCSITDAISWDGNWLYGDLYRLAGDAAVAFLLAHEYGHLVQNRLGADSGFARTIEAELNADCLAGAWFGAVDEHVAELTDEDYVALYGAVLDVADPAGLPWQDPTAHGTAEQRGDALLFGARRGPRACFGRYSPGFTL